MSKAKIPQDPDDPLVTTREAAVTLGVSLRSIQLWANAGRIPVQRTPGGHRRIRMSDVLHVMRTATPREIRVAAQGDSCPIVVTHEMLRKLLRAFMNESELSWWQNMSPTEFAAAATKFIFTEAKAPNDQNRRS